MRSLPERPLAGRARWLGAIALVTIAVLAIFSALDRLSSNNPEFAQFVPGPMRASSELADGRLAVLSGQRDRAVRLARKAVMASPADPAALALLGQSRLSLAELHEAQEAFRAAAAFGWREPATQAYWLQAALQSGDWTAAALRADALLRSRPELRVDFALLEPFELQPAGQVALRQVVEPETPWLVDYLNPSSALDANTLARRASFLSQTRTSILDCGDALPLTEALMAGGLASEARRLWGAHCGNAGLAGPIRDADFKQLAAGRASPFGWRRVASGDVTFTARTGGIEARNRGAAPRLALWQALDLADGTYRVAPVEAAKGWRVALACGTRPPDKPPRANREFTVRDCPSQALGIWVEPGRARSHMKAIALERVD